MPAIVLCDGCGANCLKRYDSRPYRLLRWMEGGHWRYERYCARCQQAGKGREDAAAGKTWTEWYNETKQ